MNKRQSAFVKQSADAYGKNVYYRFVKNTRYNWRKLLALIATTLIQKMRFLQKEDAHTLLIIDDTVEPMPISDALSFITNFIINYLFLYS